MIKKKSILAAILIALLILTLAVMTGCETTTKEGETEEKTTGEVYERAETITSPEEAKKLLEEGNKRFTDEEILKKDISSAKLEELAKGQKPFAVIVTCSDSRVAPELFFDQGLGDIFVVRVAGNVVDPIGVGSVEYAVEHLKAAYVLVVGHEKCGAVKATVEGGAAPGSIGSIVEKIKPSVEKAKASGVTGEELVEKAVDENVSAVMADLEKSLILEEAVKAGKIKIEGAKYHLESGEVTWFEEGK